MAEIITVGREYGSGGRLIAKMVAEQLNIPFYDKMLIAMVARKGGYALEFVEETGEYSTTGSLLFNVSMNGMYRQTPFADDGLSMADKVQILQTQVIQEIAQEGPCVIVGRSSDYILRNRGDVLNVFIHADLAHKTERAVTYFGIAKEHVKKELHKKDKARAAHYRHYTDRDWSAANNYHLSLDSGKFGIQGCVELIVKAAKTGG